MMKRTKPVIDEIMQQEIRPLLAVDIIEQLHRQFALLSGGRGKDGAPIITFPEYSSFSELPDEDFLNVVTYLTSIPSLDAASIGFVIIIDRRRDKWSSVKASLSRIAGAFPGNLQLVLVLRPSRFLQRAIADIGIKLHRDDFKMKIVMLNSLSDLHGYVDKGQLTSELGGELEYCHSQWIHHRTAIENFALTVKTTAQMLQKFGTDLAETELPNDVQCTKDLLATHTEKHDKLRDELKLAMKQGTTLLSCIKEQAAKSESRKLNPDETENQTTVERLMAQLDETENAFEQFWSRHHLKLEQCLQLRHFEHDFREVKVSLDSLTESLTSLSDIGDCVARVEFLLKNLKTIEENAQGSLEKAQLHALHGDQLIQSDHYAVDSIRPKCVELRRVCDDFTNEGQKKNDILSKSLQIHRGIDKVNQWCESGMYLLASQAVDKCQSQEGAESALADIERFLETAQDNQLTELRNIHNQYELVLSDDVKASVQRALSKLEDVQEMFEKRHVSLKKLAAKQTRPVQPVAPRPESSPKRPAPKTPRTAPAPAPPLTRRTSDHSNSAKQPSDADLAKKKNIRKAKGSIKIEVMHEASQGGSTHVLVTNETEESLLNRRRHIMTELIETERLYVEELQSIMEGYSAELDNAELSHLIPPALENKRDVLFGNLPEIYEFHNRTLEPVIKETEVPRRFSLASSIASSSAARRTKGPLAASVKTKRHEIKSDPTPFGYEDTLRGALPVAGKGKGSTVAGPTVPRSTSQPVNQKGWTQRRLPSMDTEDFETIPSSAEELSNSSDGEEDNKNGDSNRFRVQLTYESRTAQDLSLESGDLVQFLEEAENGHWLVKNLITEKTGLVPPSVLQAAADGDIFSDLCTAALSDSDDNDTSTWGDVSQDSR
ncbi:probable guanine nucleotide exchange factor MCF2L2 [Osmerus mordax]|uniref:probable guanine nucleotide exchange factor MCF2L2 n=1 Tax=Osmerus mordax TaxID=8014 RepID=UPI00350FEC13